MHHDDFATESNQTTTDPKRRYLCRHIFTDGHRCGSPALRRQAFCYYHRLARPSVSNEGRPTIFQMPPISDRPAIQNALFEILTRAAGGDLEYRHAAILFYGLQLASNNLNRMENAKPTTEPLVEEVFHDPDGGFLAPIAEYPEPPAASAPPASANNAQPPSDNEHRTTDNPPTTNEPGPPSRWDPLHDAPPTSELILAAVHAAAAPPNLLHEQSASKTARSADKIELHDPHPRMAS